MIKALGTNHDSNVKVLAKTLPSPTSQPSGMDEGMR